MRTIYAILIYATLLLAVATLWALARDRQTASELARARTAAARPQVSDQDDAPPPPTTRAVANDHEHPDATPTTHPADTIDPTP